MEVFVYYCIVFVAGVNAVELGNFLYKKYFKKNKDLKKNHILYNDELCKNK